MLELGVGLSLGVLETLRVSKREMWMALDKTVSISDEGSHARQKIFSSLDTRNPHLFCKGGENTQFSLISQVLDGNH